MVLNPMRAGMVKQLRFWKWSSYPAMTGKAKPLVWLETDWILGHFGKQRKRAVTPYIEFVREGKGLESVWDHKIHPVILGDESFVESIYKHHVEDAAKEVKEISRLERRKKSQPLVNYFSRGVSRADGIVAAYCTREYSQKEIADHLGIHYSTVSRALRGSSL